jgi:RNA polymerase sigma factor (sigma-70 family)
LLRHISIAEITMAVRSFPTTRWSLILSSTAETGTQAQDALAELCRTYWYPVYSFIRARTSSADDAQDLTQEFFLHFLNKGLLRSANPAAGRFRSYLAASLKHFLADQADRRNAQKRGGAAIMLSIDLAQAEQRYARDLEYRETPDRVFDRQWAVTIVTQACDQLRDLLVREGRELWFDRLQNFLPGGSEPSSYATVARELGMTEAATKVAIHRLRQRYRDLLRANVSHTVADPTEVDDEIRFLLNSLSP